MGYTTHLIQFGNVNVLSLSVEGWSLTAIGFGTYENFGGLNYYAGQFAPSPTEDPLTVRPVDRLDESFRQHDIRVDSAQTRADIIGPRRS